MRRRIVISGVSLGWPERIVVGVLAVLLVTAAFAFGLVVLGLGLVAGGVLALRGWWLRRHLGGGERAGPTVIDGEYRVLDRRDDDRDGDGNG